MTAPRRARSERVLLAIFLAACAWRPLSFGALDGEADASASDAAARDAGPALVLRIVEGREHLRPEPIGGAHVRIERGADVYELVSDAGGHVAIDGAGGARFLVTVVAEGYPALTVVDFDASTATGAPAEIGLGAFQECEACDGAMVAEGPIVRTSADSRVVLSVPGDVQVSLGTRWLARLDGSLAGRDVELGALELVGDRLVGIGRGVAAAEATLVLSGLDAVARTAFRVEPLTGVSALDGLPVVVALLGEDEGGRTTGSIHGYVELSAGGLIESSVEHAELLPRVSFHAEVADIGRTVLARARVAPGELLRFEPPPSIDASRTPAVLRPGRVVHVVPSTASCVHVVSVVSYRGTHWALVLPEGAREVAWPSLPGAVSIERVLPLERDVRLAASCLCFDGTETPTDPARIWARYRGLSTDARALVRFSE